MSTMSKESECSLAKGHGEINGSKDVMGTPTKVSFKAEMICVHDLKELMDLELIATNVDILTLFEEKKNSPKFFHSNVIRGVRTCKMYAWRKIIGWNCFIVNSNLIPLETSCFCSNFRNVGFIVKGVSASLIKVFAL